VHRVTERERIQFEKDTEQFGLRVAEWFRSEAQGWSALDQLIYWAGVRKHATSFKDPGQWAA
jgi:hypothetical protein